MPLPKSHVWLSFWPGSYVFLLFLVFLIYLVGCTVWWIINLVFCCSYSQCPSHAINSSERGGGGLKTGSEWKNIRKFIHSVWHLNNESSLVTTLHSLPVPLSETGVKRVSTRSSLPPWPLFLKREAENVSEHPSSNHTGSIQMLHLL